MHADLLGHARSPSARQARRGACRSRQDRPARGLSRDNVYLFSGNEDQTVTRPVVRGSRAASYKEAGVEAEQPHPGGEGRRPCLHHRARRSGLRHLGHALRHRLRLRPGQGDPRLDLRPARRRVGRAEGPLHPVRPAALRRARRRVRRRGRGLCPAGCAEQTGCRVHVALHGCEQSREKVGDDFIKESGFAEIADTNRLIVLFPQVKASTASTRKAAGTGGAIRASTISARTRPRSQRSGPWSSSLPRGREAQVGGRTRHCRHRGASRLRSLSPISAPS